MSLLEESIHDHANNRGKRLKDLEKKIKTIKAQLQSASKELKVGSEIPWIYHKYPSKPCASIFIQLPPVTKLVHDFLFTRKYLPTLVHCNVFHTRQIGYFVGSPSDIVQLLKLLL